MTTNITPIEALNEIDKQITQINLEYSSNYKIRRFQEGQLDSLNFAKQILTQAIAPQETQQKTFTVDEIKEILFSFCDDDCSNSENPDICKLGGFDCRKCIMKKFEKAVE